MLLHGHLCHILQPMQEYVARHGDTPSGKCAQRLLHGHPRQNKSIQRRKFIVNYVNCLLQHPDVFILYTTFHTQLGLCLIRCQIRTDRE